MVEKSYINMQSSYIATLESVWTNPMLVTTTLEPIHTYLLLNMVVNI